MCTSSSPPPRTGTAKYTSVKWIVERVCVFYIIPQFAKGMDIPHYQIKQAKTQTVSSELSLHDGFAVQYKKCVCTG